MAYGQKLGDRHEANFTSNQINSGQKTVYYVYDDVKYSRYGTNSPRTARSATRSMIGAIPKYYVKNVKVYLPGTRKDGKPRYTYERVTFVRYVWPKGSKRKGRKAGYTKPNELSFYQASVVSMTPGDATGRYLPKPSWGPRRMTGQICGGIKIPFADFYWSAQAADAPYRPSDFMGDPVNLVSGLLPEIEARALAKFYAQLKGQDANLAVALAEGRQTLSMIGQAASKLARGLLALKKGNIKKAVDALEINSKKGLASHHLAYNYGVAPLLSDIDGLAKMVAERAFQSESYSVSASAGRFGVESKGYRLHSYAFKGRSDYYDKYSVTVKLTARVRIKNGLVSSYYGKTLSALGFSNPLAVAWEIVPFSFIADWFIPIGEYLNNLDALALLEVESVHKTIIVTRETRVETTIGGLDSTGVTWTESARSGFSTKSFGMRRNVLTEIPSLPLPSFKDPVSSGHIANAIALFIQLKK